MLSKHLAQILKPMVGLDFCNQMQHVKLEEDDELVSFNVVSLFTSIPVNLAIQVATDVLSKDDPLQDRTAVPAIPVEDRNFRVRILDKNNVINFKVSLGRVPFLLD